MEYLPLDLSDGSTLTMDALLAAGDPPNIYVDYIGRASKYLVPDFSLDLSQYIDTSVYQPSALAPFMRDGQLLGLPQPGGAQAMAVNLEIMDEIGYTVPDRWTIDDFLEMAALVRDYYDGEKWATGMFAGNQSGDYLINNWFAAFGVEKYAEGYDHTTIQNGGAEVYEFFQTLVREGFVPPGSATLVDDDYVIQWAVGDLAATAFFEGWTEPYFNSVIAQGLRDEPFPYEFVPFPRAEGVENVPSYMSNGAMVAFQTGDPIADAAAAAWIAGANGRAAQSHQVIEANTIANRTDVTVQSANPHVAQIAAVVAAGGIMDVGLTSPFFAAVRPTHVPVLQQVLNLDITPEEGIEEWARRINEALR